MTDKKTLLLTAATTIFAEKGFKETNVTAITKAAGMSTGSFYNYFASKDQLFMEVYLEENKKLKESILAQVDTNAPPLEVIGRVLQLNTVGMQSNPILKEWYNKEIFGRIEEAYRQENGLERVGFVYDFFLALIEKWQQEGKMRSDIEPDMIMAIFEAIITVDTHKEEIGLRYFPKLMDHLARLVMDGLLIEGNELCE
ncbi:MAG: TetR/AcrR family transcriptional regulator [Eubacteriales bacterium]|jgi:AcrR family transcriptional regulator|nr:TetR/AcrR family transcriptional regulator [Eubacteriales bacterium]